MSKKEILIQAAEIIRNQAQKDLESMVLNNVEGEAFDIGMKKNVLYTDTVDSLIEMIKEV